MLNTLTEIEKFKESLPDKHMNCLEVVKCRSHQPTLLCVVNSSQSLKKHFCETNSRDVIGSFFSWIVTDVLKPTNSKKEQKMIMFSWHITDLLMILSSYTGTLMILLVAGM